VAETPHEFAHLRAKEIKRLLARLKSGQPLSELDVATAIGRAEDAKRRSIEAHLKAAERHLSSAEVHERAAAMYETQAAQDPKNVEARLRGVDNRAAAERKRVAADAEVRRAMQAAGPPR
jgi:hypothetical protein